MWPYWQSHVRIQFKTQKIFAAKKSFFDTKIVIGGAVLCRQVLVYQQQVKIYQFINLKKLQANLSE